MKNVLRLKELYLDDKYFNNKDLEIHWGNGNGDIISIKSNGRCIFGPLDIRINGQSLTVSSFYLLPIHLLTLRQLA